MEAYHQPYRFMRPPPPPPYSMPEPSFNQFHYHQNNAPPRQQVPPQTIWYSGQFQHHSSHSPSPPPPHWAPTRPPHSDHLFPPAHPFPLCNNSIPPYHAQSPHNQFPPSPRTQGWNNSNWAPHQGWEYSEHNNEFDWAARAREWATAKSVMDNQPPYSQSPPIERLGEQNKYQYPDFHQQSHPSLSYQQYPIPHESLVEAGSIGSKSGPYDNVGHTTYAAFSDGAMTAESSAIFPQLETVSSCPSVLLQEVPSSYSSGSGKEGTPNQNERLYKSLHFPISSDQGQQQHVHPSMPSLGRSTLLEQPHFQYANPSASSTVSLADQPLDFVPRFNRNHDTNLQPGCAHIPSVNPVSSLPSLNNWAPTIGPGTAYASPGPQHDPSMAVPPQISDHSRIVAQYVHPPVSPFGTGVSSSLHSTTCFSTDPYGVSAPLERPKKASVPNWIREEIIKKKPAITSSIPEYPIQGEEESFEVDAIDKSVLKGGQEDIKSLDSSRSAEEEDDEDSVEAAKTAAINQEIKRILTEVLLKVTDDLFDEIASKVVNESDFVVEDPSIATQHHNPSSSPPALKPLSNVILPCKADESHSDEDGNKNPISCTAGNILGLVNYASDDDEDDEIPSSRIQNSVDTSVHQKSDVKESTDIAAIENGSLQAEFEDHDSANPSEESGPNKSVSVAVITNSCAKDEAKTTEEKIANAMEPRLLEEDAINAKNLFDFQSKQTETMLDKNGVPGFSGKHNGKQLKTGNIEDEKQVEYCRKLDDTHLITEKRDERNKLKHWLKGKEPELRKKSFELDAVEERKETQKLRKYGDKEGSYRKKERDMEGMGDRRHKRRRSSSNSDSMCLNREENSIISHAYDSSDDTSEDSRRKRNSKKQNMSPSPSRRRVVLRSPRSKRRHSPYSSSVAASSGRRYSDGGRRR